MACILECIYATSQMLGQDLLWNIISPTLANQNFLHVHPPHEVPPSYLMHFLPCKMKGVVHPTPFEFDIFSTLTLEYPFGWCSKKHMQPPIHYQAFMLHLPFFQVHDDIFWLPEKMIPI